MKRQGIKISLLLINMVPLIVVTLLITIGFFIHRYYDLEAHVKNKGHFIIQHLETVSEYALVTHNNSLLKTLISTTLGHQEVISVAIFDINKHLILFDGPIDLRQTVISHMQWNTANQVNNQKIAPHIMNYSVPIVMDNKNSSEQKTTSLSPEPLLGWISVSLSTSQDELEFVESLIYASLIIMIILGLGLLLSKIFFSSMSNLLLKLKNALHAINTRELTTPVNFNSSLHEINELQDDLNQLATHVKDQEENFNQAIEEATRDLTKNLETLEINNVGISRARKEALELSRMKTQFIANMAHEIRNPMNSIIGFGNLLSETHLSTNQREYLEVIQKSARGLLFNINDILDFSKMESGKLQFDHIPTDIRDCVDEVLQSLAPNAQTKKVELISRIDPTVPSKILNDPLRLKQILSNLTSNAIKFTSEGTVTIHVTIKEKERKLIKLQIDVIDTGIGITPEEQKTLFNPFTQISNPMSHMYIGTGLGLVISKKLIEQMGGSISVKSQPDAGSTFSFTMDSEEIPTIHESPLHEKLNSYKVLIYDENPVVGKELHTLCSSWNLQATLVENIDELKSELSKKHAFNTLLFGVNQFDIKDYKLIQLFSDIKNLYSGPIITLVNNNQSNIKDFTLAVGSTLCISKPFSRRKLYQDLVELLENINPLEKTPSESTSKKQIRILIVEDNPANLMLMNVLIERIGALAVTATDGREGVRVAKEHKFDLILLDFQMPNMNGLEATKNIRSNPGKNKNTPIIIVSAFLTEKDKAALATAGVSESIMKPFDETQLQALIKKYIYQKNSKSTGSKKINGAIDWELCLDRASGKKDLAEIFLKEFLQELPQTRHEIQKNHQDKKFQDLTNVVHKLHGACCYTGVPFLKIAAAEFEKGLKSEVSESILNSLMKNSLTEIDRVIEEGKKIIN